MRTGRITFEEEKSRHGAYRMRMSASDLALLGQLWNVVPDDEKAGGSWFFHTGAPDHSFDQQYLFHLIDLAISGRIPETATDQ